MGDDQRHRRRHDHHRSPEAYRTPGRRRSTPPASPRSRAREACCAGTSTSRSASSETGSATSTRPMPPHWSQGRERSHRPLATRSPPTKTKAARYAVSRQRAPIWALPGCLQHRGANLGLSLSRLAVRRRRTRPPGPRRRGSRTEGQLSRPSPRSSPGSPRPAAACSCSAPGSHPADRRSIDTARAGSHPRLILSHFGLAAAGLAIWIVAVAGVLLPGLAATRRRAKSGDGVRADLGSCVVR